MPIGLSSTDRKLVAGTGGLVLLMALLIGAVAEPQGEGAQSPVPSTYSAGPGGAASAYQLLKALHYPVERWEDPPARLAQDGSGRTLILAEPVGFPTRAERTFLRQFIENGGRILFCGGALPAFFDGVSLAASPPAKAMVFRPNLPSPFTRGARLISIAPRSLWKNRKPEQVALFGSENEPVVVVWHLGRGELVWWASATPLTNQDIGKADNEAMFLDTFSTPVPNAAQHIYWDEYFHGSRGSLWAYVERTPLKWALIQCAFLLAAVLFAFSRRSGPIVTPPRISRLSPLEFVDTLGGLYERAGATSIATGIAYRHVRFSLLRRFILPAATSDEMLARSAAQRLGWNAPELASVLHQAERSQTASLPPKDALELVKKIGMYLDRPANRSTTESR